MHRLSGLREAQPVIRRLFSQFTRHRILTIAVCLLLVLRSVPQSPVSHQTVHARKGAKWHIKGDGMVCCPCKTPCPCRNNGRPSYGHCEATMYLRVRSGRYESVDLSGMHVIETGGMCATNYRHLSALYFDTKSTEEQRSAYEQIVASISPEETTEFPYVRVADMHVSHDGPFLFAVTIPGLLDFAADRSWGQSSPPMPMVAAPDTLANELQYAKNIRYYLRDPEANMSFDYSGRQANYRSVDLDQDQYAEHKMLIEFADGTGWFNDAQLELVRKQNLTLPRLEDIQQKAIQLRRGATN